MNLSFMSMNNSLFKTFHGTLSAAFAVYVCVCRALVVFGFVVVDVAYVIRIVITSVRVDSIV